MPSIEQHFTGRGPVVREIYDAILARARRLGPFREEPKKTSIHLAGKTAFAGVATRKDSLILTLKSPKDLRSRRIKKHERASANRWHLEVRLTDANEVDAEIARWLRAAYEMSR